MPFAWYNVYLGLCHLAFTISSCLLEPVCHATGLHAISMLCAFMISEAVVYVCMKNQQAGHRPTPVDFNWRDNQRFALHLIYTWLQHQQVQIQVMMEAQQLKLVIS